MKTQKLTNVPDFILLGLADSEKTQLGLFLLFLLIYLVTVLGNAGMILLIRLDTQLHTPMYFFLTHLSFLDLSYSSVITPRTLQDLVSSTKSISFLGCFMQMFFFIFLGSTECLLLSCMAYDRYVAICSPLHYPVIMSPRLCQALLVSSYTISFIESCVNAVFMSNLEFCNSTLICHFFCDTSPIVALSCSDTYVAELIIFTFAGSTLVVSLVTITGSYMSILSTILKIHSTAGKQKAFSTCASHLLGFTIFYSTTLFTYLKPKQSYSLGKDQVASVFYTIVIPMLNPLIYSLRNREVKKAAIRVCGKEMKISCVKFQVALNTVCGPGGEKTSVTLLPESYFSHKRSRAFLDIGPSQQTPSSVSRLSREASLGRMVRANSQLKLRYMVYEKKRDSSVPQPQHNWLLSVEGNAPYAH
ncbi:olfactory receptor 8H1-like [Octodon degus]|uniref:Olfactory receptor 8H1-like n=1 Tax=Octodon degus TaxID=10160 RepID=A0A6P3FWM9_OCTDE|nr:olfactory receptor 8H1-like [Octodon degus]